MKRAFWIVALAVALPACGGGSNPSPVNTPTPPPVGGGPSPSPSPVPSPSPTPTPEPSPTPTPEATPTPEPLEDVVVNIVNMTFQPASITVKTGQKVIWKNKDSQTHTATADSGEFGTGFIDPGAQASVVIQSVGEFNYHCSVHPTMKGTVIGEK